jgi:hypothetical protein
MLESRHELAARVWAIEYVKSFVLADLEWNGRIAPLSIDSLPHVVAPTFHTLTMKGYLNLIRQSPPPVSYSWLDCDADLHVQDRLFMYLSLVRVFDMSCSFALKHHLRDYPHIFGIFPNLHTIKTKCTTLRRDINMSTVSPRFTFTVRRGVYQNYLLDPLKQPVLEFPSGWDVDTH